MGRFCVTDDASDISMEECDRRKGWEFVGDPGEENAIVIVPGGEKAGREEDSWNGNTKRQQHINNRLHRQRRQRSSEEWENVPYDDLYWRNERFFTPSPEKPRRTSYAFFWLSIFMILVACLWKDPPPAPPSLHCNNDDSISLSSWREYLMIHVNDFTRSAMALGIHVPLHMLSWLAASIRTDVQLWYEQLQLQRRAKQCHIQRYDDLHLDTMMVAQDLAVEWLSESMRVWKQTRQQPTPLVFLAVGYPHSGKRTLCNQMVTRIRDENCPPADFVLHISGSAWNDDVLIDDVYRKLQDQIKTHALSGGNVLLLTRVDEMAPTLVKMLLEDLGPDCASKEDDNICHVLEDHIIYMTSSAIGSTSIARNLRASGGILRGTSSLAADLRDEAERQFGMAATSAITTILPFGPMTPDDLKEILRKRVELFSENNNGVFWKRFHVSDSVTGLFLSKDRVDYLEWKSRPKASTKHPSDSSPSPTQQLMTVSVEGARILDDKGAIMTKINAQVEQMLSIASPQKEKVVFMDTADTASTISSVMGFQHVVLQWCDEQPDGSLLNCYEAHRFRV